MPRGMISSFRRDSRIHQFPRNSIIDSSYMAAWLVNDPCISAMNACVRGATRCTNHPSIHFCLEVLNSIGHGLFHRSLIRVMTQYCAHNIGPCIAQQLPEGRSWPLSTSTPLKSLMSIFAPSRRRHSPCLRWHHVSKKM